MSLVNPRFMFGRDFERYVQRLATVLGAPTPPAASDNTPPRHSADDYRAIAERLKQLGYRGWITG